MKNTIKFVLVITLFCSAAFAEGDMGVGGRTCPAGQTCIDEPNDPENTNPLNDSGSDAENSDESILETISEYFGSIF